MNAQSQSKLANYATWFLQILIAAAFLAAGTFKLLGAPEMVAVFDMVGIGQWFRYVVAIIEIASAIALLVPGFAAPGAATLAVAMVGAIIAHLTRLHTPFMPAAILLILSLLVLWLRKDQLHALRARFT